MVEKVITLENVSLLDFLGGPRDLLVEAQLPEQLDPLRPIVLLLGTGRRESGHGEILGLLLLREGLVDPQLERAKHARLPRTVDGELARTLRAWIDRVRDQP